MDATDYVFLSTPVPIARTKRLTRLEKDVYSVLLTWKKLTRRWISVTQIADLAGAGGNRNKVRGALSRLAELGLVSAAEEVDGRTRWEVHWPEWIEAEAAGDLWGRKCTDGDQDTPVFDDKIEEAPIPGGVGPQVPVGPGDPEGGSRGPSRWVQGTHYKTYKRELREKATFQVADRPEEDEEEEPNPEGGSVCERARQDELSVARREKKAAGGSRKRKPSGPECATEPSARWEFQRHRRRPVGKWTGLDLLGYWVCRHAELRGREDPDFEVRDVSVEHVRKCARNGATFVRRYFAGDYSAAQEVVEAALERAEARGRPVSFVYYFTPSRDAAAREILKAKPGRRLVAGQSTRERNDRLAVDEDYWRKRAEAQVAERGSK